MAERRTARLNELVRDRLSTILTREINDPRLRGLVTVTAVDVSRDLTSARVWVSVIGDREAGQVTLQGLKSASGFLLRGLATLGLRKTPELRFVLDESMERADRVRKILDEVLPDSADLGAPETG